MRKTFESDRPPITILTLVKNKYKDIPLKQMLYFIVYKNHLFVSKKFTTKNNIIIPDLNIKIGKNTELSYGVTIYGNTKIGSNSYIGYKTRLMYCKIYNNCYIGALNIINNSVIRGWSITDRSCQLVNCLIGDRMYIPYNIYEEHDITELYKNDDLN